MPWVKVEEGHQEVYSYCRCQGDDEIREDVVADGDFLRLLDLSNNDVETGEDVVGHDNSVNYH